MWERSARSNPLSMRNRYYMDHRPILPQDPTWQRYRRAYSNYQIIYFQFLVNGKRKFILSNNIPAKDRERMKQLTAYHDYFSNILNKISYLPAIFLAGLVFRNVNMGYKALYLVGAFLALNITRNNLRGMFDNYYNANMSYFFHRYSNLAVEDLQKIEDPRRKHFKLDTRSYYRESADDILHKHHHDDGAGHGHHDTSTYYGPHPYDDYENLDNIMNIDAKFRTGKSLLDNPENENVLGEPIDIKRVVRNMPTLEDYRSL